MNTQQILDLLLSTGQELVNKGKSIAEEKLNLPDNPDDRKRMLDGAGKGALAAGAAAILIGTQFGRKLTGASLKLGSLAAIGGIAYNAFQKWQEEQVVSTTDVGKPLEKLTGATSEERGKLLLKAMIAAAKVDGTIDDREKELISQQLSKLNLGELAELLTAELNTPLDIKAITAGADSPAAAAEIYLISRSIIDLDNVQERNYMELLAKEMNLPADLIAEMESQLKI